MKSDSSPRPTCGPLYLEGLTHYTQGDTQLMRVYAAGFVNGQAEKVYLGACFGAMFRPSAERHDLVLEIAKEAATRYGLVVTEYQDEIWICRDFLVAEAVESLASYEPNSSNWHSLRGWLCGIPLSEIDRNFHLRKGFGEVCDAPREKSGDT